MTIINEHRPMNKINIQHLDEMFTDLMKSDYIPFEEIKKMKNTMGVYMIYSPEGELIYIGSTNKFNIRFGTDLRHESTHTLVRKLINQGVFVDRKAAVEYLTTKCKFLIQVCETKREAEALEHFII